MKLLLALVVVYFSACKVEPSAELKSENPSVLDSKIAKIEGELSQLASQKEALSRQYAVLVRSSDASSFALVENPEYKSDDTYSINKLKDQIARIEIREAELKLELAKLKVKKGEFTEEQLNAAIAELEARRKPLAQELDRTRRLYRDQCKAVYVIEDRTSRQSREEALEGTYYTNNYKVLTCETTANNCNGDVFSDDWSRPTFRVSGAPYSSPESLYLKSSNMNRAKSLVGKECPCHCERVRSR